MVKHSTREQSHLQQLSSKMSEISSQITQQQSSLSKEGFQVVDSPIDVVVDVRSNILSANPINLGKFESFEDN